jgi:hypothetical protein
MLQAITENGIDIAWSVSMGDSISYASIELIAGGVPVFFINIDERFVGKNCFDFICSKSQAETAEFHLNLREKREILSRMQLDQNRLVRQRYDSRSLAGYITKIYHLA